MKNTIISIGVFVLLMLVGAWALQGSIRDASEPSYTGNGRTVLFQSELGPIFERDADYVYCVGNDASYQSGEVFEEIIISDDPDSFHAVLLVQKPDSDLYDWYYSADSSSVYYNCEKLAGADPQTFAAFFYDFGVDAHTSNGYGYDTNYIYYRDQVFEENNQATWNQYPGLEDVLFAIVE